MLGAVTLSHEYFQSGPEVVEPVAPRQRRLAGRPGRVWVVWSVRTRSAPLAGGTVRLATRGAAADREVVLQIGPGAFSHFQERLQQSLQVS